MIQGFGRAVRERISEQYGHDVTQFLNHYRELDKKYQERLISSTKTQKAQQTHNGYDKTEPTILG